MFFDREDYNKVMAGHNWDTTSTMEDQIGVEYIGYSVMNQCLSAILKLLQWQRDNSSNNLTKEAIKSGRVMAIMKHVENRKVKVSRANYKEKLTHSFAPFRLVGRLGEMEERLWNRNNNSMRNGMAALRDRFTFLETLGAVLRGESLYKGELSDLCDFIHKTRLDPHPFHCLIINIEIGKVNKNKTLFGRSKNLGSPPLLLDLRFQLRLHLCELH